MTLKQLLECDAATLERMTDEQLLEHFKPYLNVTRPELAPRPVRLSDKQTTPVYISPQKQKHLELLKAEGVDMSFLNRMKRK